MESDRISRESVNRRRLGLAGNKNCADQERSGEGKRRTDENGPGALHGLELIK
jgi:hypothetical protein